MTDAGPRWDADSRIEDILAIVAKETSIDRQRLTPDATIEALGIASLDIVQAIFEIESRFDVEIPPISSTAATEFATIGDLVRHVLATLDGRMARAAAADSAA